MHKFPIKRLNTPKSFHITKFPKEVDFSNFKDTKIRQKTIEDEMIVDDQITDNTKRVTKQDGHIATSDRQYFGDRKSGEPERKTLVLDDSSLTTIRYEGNAIKESQNTCYYIFIKKGKDFIALPVEENWTHFKPVVKQKTQSVEDAEALMNAEKQGMKGFFQKLASKVPGFEEVEEEVPKKKSKKKIKDEDERSYLEGGFSDDEEFDYGKGDDVSEPEEEKEDKEDETKSKIKKEDWSSDEETRKTKKRKQDQLEMPTEKKIKVENSSVEAELKNAIIEIIKTQSKVTIKKLTKYLTKTKNFEINMIKDVLSHQMKQLVKLEYDEETGQKILLLK